MENYDDIINHENYKSKTRPQMSMMARAAQFSSFAALTGYEEMISNEEKQLIDETFKLECENYELFS